MAKSRGFNARLASEAGVSKQFVSDVFARRRKPSEEVAKRLEDASIKAGMYISYLDFLNADVTNHPKFK